MRLWGKTKAMREEAMAAHERGEKVLIVDAAAPKPPLLGNPYQPPEVDIIRSIFEWLDGPGR